MRASILAWSTVSGIIMGVLIDAALIGAAFLLVLVWPDVTGRLNQRWITIGAAMLLAATPVVLAVFGYLEGVLKTG